MPRGNVTADGRKVARLRGEAALTQADLAALAGFGLRTICKLESGQATTGLTLSAVATVLSRKLNRPITLADLLQKPPEPSRSEPTLLVAEQIKVLDLRRWQSSREHPVELTDHHRFRRIPEDLTEIAFHYGTTGTLLRGRCLSHPDRYEWLPATANGHFPRLNVGCVLRLRLASPPGPAGCDVQNTIEYLDGFRGETREWFEANITNPTQCLSLLMLFPEEKPFRSMRGLYQPRPGAPLHTVPEQPVRLQQGRLASWHVSAPRVGEIYRVEWEW